MKIAVVLGAGLVLASACKKKDAATPASGAGSSAGSAIAAMADAAPESPPGPAVLEMVKVDTAEDLLVPTFGKEMPSLPALDADGTLIATLDYTGSGPAFPAPMQVTISTFPSADKKVQELPILTDDEAIKTSEMEADKWLTPELAKTLAARGKTIVEKLAGFHSLHAVKLESGSDTYDVKPAKIGDLTFKADRNDTGLVVTLANAQGKMIHREQVDSYTEGSGDMACTFNPVMGALYTDPPKPRALYVEVSFRYRDDCGAPGPTYLAWSTDPNSTTPEEAIHDVVARQFELLGERYETLKPELLASDALCIDSNTVEVADEMPGIGPGNYDGHDDRLVTVTMSRDGKSAWASLFTTLKLGDLKHGDMPQDRRASDFLVQTPKGWRIAARTWTADVDNASVNKDAKAGKLKAEPLKPEPGDASLNAAFAKLTTDGANNVAKDIVAIGSGPNERTVGDAAFKKPWNAAWKGKTTIVSSVARLAPSGTTGWVAATVELQKTGYKIPFTVFAVFDKDASGAWTLVHIHFAV